MNACEANPRPVAGAASPLASPPPALDLVDGRYRLRFARDEDDLDALLRLRFEVFNRELGEGLRESWATGRDRDRFDEVCHHLLVEEATTGAPVGTYRLQTAAMAARHHGFYSAGEFDLAALPAAVREAAVELGRACVAREHRNRRVLFLLWRGLARYVAAHGLRYLFGCSSLTSQDPAAGVAFHRWLGEHGHLHRELLVPPLPALACASRGELPPPPPVPTLFRTYLRHGAWVLGPPALDRAFQTIDFLVLLDIHAMDPDRFRAFFG